MATEKRIVATGHAIVGGAAGSPSTVLAPGKYVVFQEGDKTHKAIEREIANGTATSLEIQEVDLDDERESKQAQEELEQKLAAEEAERQSTTEQAARVAAGEGNYNPEEHTVAEVLEYLKQASPEEVKRVQELEAASERGSKQVSDFEPKES